MRKIFSIIKKISKPLKLHRFPFFARLNKKITEKVRTNHAVVDGHAMILDDKDSLRLSINGIYEIEQTNYIKNLLNEGDCAIDIGANIGYYALVMAKRVGLSGKVFCFEPDKTNFSILKKNVENNQYSNTVYLYNDAISFESGKIKLYISESNRGDHRIYSSDQNRDFIEINAIRLDEVKEIMDSEIKLIKIDIQGSEMIALESMKKVIKKNKPIIISEFWPKGIRMSGKNAEDYINYYISVGYSLNLLEGKGLKKITKVELDNLVTVEKGNFTNIVFVPLSD